jgi:ABC-2 type transport system permease protein
MGAAMLVSGGVSASRGRPRLLDSAATVLGRSTAHLTLYLAPLGLFLVILPRIYGFSTLGRPLDLFLFAVPFILATSLMGQSAGAWFRRRETAVVLFVATTLPQFFLVGVSWPAESVPPALRAAGRVFPSESAIDGLVRINQMGASLREVWPDWMALWVLAGVYLVFSVLSARFGAGRESTNAA